MSQLPSESATIPVFSVLSLSLRVISFSYFENPNPMTVTISPGASLPLVIDTPAVMLNKICNELFELVTLIG